MDLSPLCGRCVAGEIRVGVIYPTLKTTRAAIGPPRRVEIISSLDLPDAITRSRNEFWNGDWPQSSCRN